MDSNTFWPDFNLGKETALPGCCRRSSGNLSQSSGSIWNVSGSPWTWEQHAWDDIKDESKHDNDPDNRHYVEEALSHTRAALHGPWAQGRQG